jgi:hypothetical protein
MFVLYHSDPYNTNASDIFSVFVGAATARAGGGERHAGGVEGRLLLRERGVAWLEFNNSGTAYGGGTVHIKVRLRCSR